MEYQSFKKFERRTFPAAALVRAENMYESLTSERMVTMSRVQRMLKKKSKDFLADGEVFLAGIPFMDSAKVAAAMESAAISTTLLTQMGVASSMEVETDGTKDYQYQSYLIATSLRILYARRTFVGKISRIAGEIDYSALRACELKIKTTMFSKPWTGSVRILTKEGNSPLDDLKCDVSKNHLSQAEFFVEEVNKKLGTS